MQIIKVFIDIETTGTFLHESGIHQIAGLVEIDDKVVETFDFRARPNANASISEEALKVCGISMEDLLLYPPAKATLGDLTKLLGKYINRYDKTDKAYIVGYNNRGFDDPFLRAWFELNGDPYFGSWFWPNSIDVMVLATEYLIDRRAAMPSFKLFRVAEELGLIVDKDKTHEAGYDIELTRQIYRIVTGREVEI